MRIAIDCSIQDTPWLTGVEKTQRAILKELARIDRENEYLLLSRRPVELGLELPANFRTLELSKQKPTYLWRERLLPSLLAKEQIDVYHSPVSAIPVGGQFAKIATVHEVPWLERQRRVEAARRVWLFLNVRYARRIIAVSERTRANILKLYPDAKEKVVVIHHGVDERFKPDGDRGERARVLAAHGIPDAPYLLFVGAARKKKNLGGLLDAFARIGEKRTDVRLVLAGVRNAKESGLAAKSGSLGLDGRVHFPGYVSDDELVTLYRGAEALVFPSHFEGFGLPPLEAMACGTPVVVSSGGALPEVVGDAALLVAPNDAAALASGIERVLGDEKLRKELQSKGLARSAQFTWRAAAERVIALYRTAGARAGGAGA